MNERVKGGKEIKQLEVDIDMFMYHYDSQLFRASYKLENDEITITYKADHYLHIFILVEIEEDGGPSNANYEIEGVSSNGLIIVNYEV